MPDLYFNRVPSLPATDDGSGGPLAEDLSTSSGDSEDATWDADTADAGEVPAAAGAAAGARPAGAEPREGDGDDGTGRDMAGPEADAEFTEADVAFLSAPPEAALGPGGPGSAAGLQEASPGTGEQPGTDVTARTVRHGRTDVTAARTSRPHRRERNRERREPVGRGRRERRRARGGRRA